MIEFFQKGGYQTGFFAFHKDVLNSLFVCCCLPIATGCLVGEMKDEEFSILSCICTPLGIYRARRTIQGLHTSKESEDHSMAAAACCPCCSVAQDIREWKLLSDGTLPSTTPPPSASSPQH